MQDHYILSYDGSFDGLLSALFMVFEERLDKVTIKKKSHLQDSLFSKKVEVISNSQNAARVWDGMTKYMGTAARHKLYMCFLSELPCVEDHILGYVRYAIAREENIDQDYSNADVLKVSQVTKMVGREKHRMEAFIRFKLSKDNIYFATVEPDFDVLPLITKHFEGRYADQRWLIYDLKRSYGVYYNLDKAETITLDLDQSLISGGSNKRYFSPKEYDFQELWKDYFASTNIKARKNMKLHLRHVPKRYWKYLIEKQVD
ncbi:TIGR03915 family putative DNA repair protein [Gangjinia marincola]|uniref:TIGR03915 family putative DNA repair protein n=1 Tax=Gangjinia marincola TaxID=578463 RepID=A0ABP3XS54_9FLAO